MIGQNKTRLMGVAVLVAMFAAGGLTGAVLQRSAAASNTPQQRAPRGPSLFETLELTAEQQAEVCSIIAKRREQMKPIDEALKAAFAPHKPVIDSIMHGANAEMDAVLTPEQQAKKVEFRAAREKYYKEHSPQGARREGPDRGRGGPGNPLGVKCPTAGEPSDKRGAWNDSHGAGWVDAREEKRPAPPHAKENAL